MRKVSDLRISYADYPHEGQIVRGSNLMYRVDGKPSSSRVPWIAMNPAEETARVERLLKITDRKRRVNQCRP